MNCKRIIGILFLCHLFFSDAFSQADSCNLNISLLTCGPGEDLYSVFGHSAVRVTDKNSNSDIIYNYGTFDFDDPDFYLKFTRGKLLYFVSREKVSDFIYSYRYENRSIIEQQLNLSCEEKQKLNTALQVNAREENKYYHYDFLFDNCSTRLRDIIAQNTNDTLIFNNILPEKHPSFRNMIHEYLDRGDQPWSKLGIDLLLGSKMDRPSTNNESMFLPDYLMKGFDSAATHGSSLISSKGTILESQPDVNKARSFFTPVNTSIILLVVIGILSFIRKKTVQHFLNIFDVAFFLILGLIGCLLLFMWFGTSHQLCANNYNLLWALPTHLPIAFVLLRNSSWIKKYFTISAIIYALLILCWAFLPQGMNSAFLPIALLAGLRSYRRAIKQ